ncbi:MAG: hypothetical protein SH848_02925 [Saprospiraceae bacterium]|nr:hypothetical protein [Saprospiraceae bacterium]MDZ4702854.1 hypothetical protein [Saprospiraceae bacterium]
MTLDNQLATQIQLLNVKSLEDLRLFVAFLLQKQNAKNSNNEPNGQPQVSWNWEKFPEDLSAYTVTEKDLDALVAIFEEEPSAEDLCKILTA